MKDDKIRLFMTLAGQDLPKDFDVAAPAQRRKLGAQLLLSEVLEYVIQGLGVVPVVDGTPITDANAIEYRLENEKTSTVDPLEMIDGLADVAYTMYWNSCAFGIPLEEGFELVCDNNLEKFVHLASWQGTEGPLDRANWNCGAGTEWPPEVVEVNVVRVSGSFYAVGKDQHGKVRKPSHYQSVDLSTLLPKRAANA